MINHGLTARRGRRKVHPKAAEPDRSGRETRGTTMAERSFVEEVKKLRMGAGEVFSGEGILAVTKALLESGVAYVAGYQGSPVSHLLQLVSQV